MKMRLLCIGLVISSLFCYLEWGDRSSFLYEIEMQIFTGRDPSAFLHPLVILPLAGQLLLIAAIFSATWRRRLLIAGIVLCGLLIAFIFIAGMLVMRVNVILSTLPFLALSAIAIKMLITSRSRPNRIKV